MKQISLNEKEISLINNFVEDVTKHQMVETIFVHAYKSSKKPVNNGRIRVVCVASSYINYLEQLNRTGDFTREEWDSYVKLLDSYEKIAKKETGRLDFKGRTHVYYSQFENVGIMPLEMGGGAMLYDRFGNNQCYNVRVKYPYENALEIVNVQELLDKEEKESQGKSRIIKKPY